MECVEYLSPPGSDESVSAKSICESLERNKVSFTVSEAISEVDVTQFVKKEDTPTATDAVSLFIHMRYEKLPEEVRAGLYEIVKERVRYTDDDKYMLPFKTVMITIERS